MNTVIIIILAQLVFFAICFFVARAWLAKQKDRLLSRYRLSTVLLCLAGALVISEIIHSLFFSSPHDHSMSTSGLVVFTVLLLSQQNALREIKKRKENGA